METYCHWSDIVVLRMQSMSLATDSILLAHPVTVCLVTRGRNKGGRKSRSTYGRNYARKYIGVTYM